MACHDSQETDVGFCSGPWTGFYTVALAGHRRFHRMNLDLKFRNQRIEGHGDDDVGFFTVKGIYELSTRTCSWIKNYSGRHKVHYHGLQTGQVIRGEWMIQRPHTGRFSIWPWGESGLAVEFFAEEEDPVSREMSLIQSLIAKPGHPPRDG